MCLGAADWRGSLLRFSLTAAINSLHQPPVHSCFPSLSLTIHAFFLGHVLSGQSFFFFLLIFAFCLRCKTENRLAKHFTKTCSQLKNGVYRRTTGTVRVVFQGRTWLQQGTGSTRVQVSSSLYLYTILHLDL